MVGGMSCSSPFAASFGWDEGLVMSHLGHVTRVVGNLGEGAQPLRHVGHGLCMPRLFCEGERNFHCI